MTTDITLPRAVAYDDREGGVRVSFNLRDSTLVSLIHQAEFNRPQMFTTTINWAGCGAQNMVATEEFMIAMRMAQDLGKMLNDAKDEPSRLLVVKTIITSLGGTR